VAEGYRTPLSVLLTDFPPIAHAVVCSSWRSVNGTFWPLFTEQLNWSCCTNRCGSAFQGNLWLLTSAVLLLPTWILPVLFLH